MKRILERMSLGSLGLVMFVPLFAGVLFVAVLMGTIAVFSRSGPPRLTFSYPTVDRQGHERQVTVTITGQEQKNTSEDVKQMAKESDLEASLALLLGPQSWKVFETRLKVQFPFKELLDTFMSPGGPSDGFKPGGAVPGPSGPMPGLNWSPPPELQPLLAELQSKDLKTILNESNDTELKALLGNDPERRFREITGRTHEQAFMELLQQKTDLVKQLLQKKNYTGLLWEMLKARQEGLTPLLPVPPR